MQTRRTMLTRWNWILTYWGLVPRIIPILLHFPIFTVPCPLQWLTVRPHKWDPKCPASNYISLLLCPPLNFTAFTFQPLNTIKGLQFRNYFPKRKWRVSSNVCMQTVPTEQYRNYMQIHSYCWWESCWGLGLAAMVHQARGKVRDGWLS